MSNVENSTEVSQETSMFGVKTSNELVPRVTEEDYRKYLHEHDNILYSGGISWGFMANLTTEQKDYIIKYFKSSGTQFDLYGSSLGCSNFTVSDALCKYKHARLDEYKWASYMALDRPMLTRVPMGSYERDHFIKLIEAAIAGEFNGVDKEWQAEFLPRLRDIPDKKDVIAWSLRYHY